MFQNLRVVFSHQDIIILTSIFVIIIFFIFPIKKFSRVISYVIIANCCLWWIVLVFIYPPKGFNYNIYTFNASLTIYGQKAFDRIDSQSNDETKVSFRDAKYLDYTGMQHLLYVLLEYIDLYKFSSKLSAFGFRLWIILNFSLIILLIFYLNNSTEIEIGASKIWPIIFISFCPIIPFYIFITQWEDKLIFLLLPLLILFLIKSKKI